MLTNASAIDWLPRQRRVLGGFVALAVLCMAIVYAGKAAENAGAIIRWRNLIQSVACGENVYNEWTKDGSFPNPPIAGLVLWPLTLLSPVATGLAWFSLKVMMAALAIHWSIQLATGDSERRSRNQSSRQAPRDETHHMERDGNFSALPAKQVSNITESRFRLPALAALLALAARPLLSDLQHGNINILILFLVTGGLVAFRGQRDGLAGLLIGLATAIKVTPALFIPYFAFKRQWRVVAWSLTGLLVFLFIVPGTVLGFGRNWWLLKSWYGAMVEPYVVQGRVETLQVNQSLPGVWMRLVTDSPGLELEDGSTRSVNVMSLDHQTAIWCLKALMLGLLAWVAWLCRTHTNDRTHWRPACEAGLVFIAMLLISERSWKHHYVTMLLPYAAIIATIQRGTCGPAIRTILRAGLVAAFLLMASTSTELGGWLAEGIGHKYAQAYGLFCASALLALAMLSAVLLCPETTGCPILSRQDDARTSEA